MYLTRLSDQKDIIIAQLKADLFEAQKCQEQEFMIQEDLRKWEVKLQMSLDEKGFAEQESKQRKEQATRQINALQSEIKNLTTQVQKMHKEEEESILEQRQLKEINEQKVFEILQVKRDIQRLSDNLQLDNQHLEDLQGNFEDFQIECNNSQMHSNELAQKLREQQQKQNELQQLLKSIQNKQQSLQQNSKKEEIIQLNEEIKVIQEELQQNQNKIPAIQQQINQLSKENQQLNTENQRKRKFMINENQKRSDAQNRINQHTATKDHNAKQIQSLEQEVKTIGQENQQLTNQNIKMKEDWKALQQHIELLLQVNSNLVNELEYYSQDDQKVRQLLNRSNRVKQLQLRVSGGTRLNTKKNI